MNSLVYFYSKFTEEFLLLGAAGIFALLSAYCYHWVIQKRRLGIAHSQIPSAVVKSYLNQLINEAEFVRKQLFGMNNDGSTAMPIGFGAAPSVTVAADASKTAISPDLLARLGSLESQLKEKESLVVNINVEKAKLLEEIEILRANSGGTAYVEQNQKQLTDKIKNLEARLEEYALFEEDLANLKRLQQENASLKKRLSDHAAAPAGGPLGSLGSEKKEQDFKAAPPTEITEPSISAAPTSERKPPLAIVPEPEPAQLEAEEAATAATKPAAEPAKYALDQTAIDALLEGKPVTPPVAKAPEPAPAPEAAAAPAAPAPAPKPTLEAVPAGDQFEKLAESVDHSLEAEPLKAVAGDPVPTPAQAASGESSLANKSDEELLKEFENLLNS
jgi:hypothetical protein